MQVKSWSWLISGQFSWVGQGMSALSEDGQRFGPAQDSAMISGQQICLFRFFRFGQGAFPGFVIELAQAGLFSGR